MNNNIAICLTTYNHATEMYNAYSLGLAQKYDTYGFDIYFFDSSENDDTSKCIQKLNTEGCSNLYYVKVDSTVSSNNKIWLMLTGYGLKKNYDYIMPMKDRCIMTEHTMSVVSKESKLDYDIIFLGGDEIPYSLKHLTPHEVYNNPITFFHDFAVRSTDWQSTLFNTHSFLSNINWDFVSKHYHFGEAEYYGQPFQQTLILYDGLIKMNNPKIRVLYDNEIFVSCLFYSQSGWYSMITDMWTNYWPKSIKLLPDEYSCEISYVIKKQTNCPAIFGSVGSLISHFENNLISIEEYNSLRNSWYEYSSIPLEVVDLIANKDYVALYQMILDDLQDSLSECKYEKSWYIFSANAWIKNILGEEYYSILENCFKIYKDEYNNNEDITILSDTYSIADIIEKYNAIFL